MEASKTDLIQVVILKSRPPPDNNTYFKDHSWLHLIQSRRINPLVIIYDLIITPLYVAVSGTIPAMGSDDMVEVLVYQDVKDRR